MPATIHQNTFEGDGRGGGTKQTVIPLQLEPPADA